ncbi:MAG: UDP-N-acetylglucosamine--N-acetylmuramyl-(pentapeptide) pyrophosphoryl-undecaprenol N-acetylglucosamine transferase, partial [Fibrobacteres bacterium]|nr:UDP-N-acetylglucosamine--N-acetylmuramyl-(pentapeptide) pyrophosphoryl-undecaprenol N-acetylglucosamine transferase [Fibrobacterota bacterium]
TLSELAKFGLPAILIPLPNSAGDHQKKNAIDVEARGGAVCFNQNESSVQFKRIIQNLLADTEALGIMRKKMGQLFRSDSPKIIADDIRKEIKK